MQRPGDLPPDILISVSTCFLSFSRQNQDGEENRWHHDESEKHQRHAANHVLDINVKKVFRMALTAKETVQVIVPTCILRLVLSGRGVIRRIYLGHV
jgi:hypothetical protein